MAKLPCSEYDAVYCSHNLEHYYGTTCPKSCPDFSMFSKTFGFAHIRVPDLGEVMSTVVQRGLDIDDFLYQSPSGPITVRDVLFGYGVELERRAAAISMPTRRALRRNRWSQCWTVWIHHYLQRLRQPGGHGVCVQKPAQRFCHGALESPAPWLSRFSGCAKRQAAGVPSATGSASAGPVLPRCRSTSRSVVWSSSKGHFPADSLAASSRSRVTIVK